MWNTNKNALALTSAKPQPPARQLRRLDDVRGLATRCASYKNRPASNE